MSKSLKIVWLVGVLVVAGLTLRHLPAWRELCLRPATAPGRVVATGLEHGRVRYRFQSGGKTWEGTVAHHWLGGPWLELGSSVEVFYAPSEPSTNQIGRPSSGDWWRHAVSCLLFFSLFAVTVAVAMIQRLLRWCEERTIYD